MANLTEKDIKKGVLKGTDKSDDILIDSNYTGKKVTVKAGKGDDTVYAEDFGGDLYAYAGLGSDILYANTNNSYLYGESGTNTFVINENFDSTTISAGKGKAIIDFSLIQGLNEDFFDEVDNFVKVKNDLQITIPESLKGNRDCLITIKDFFKQHGEVIALHEDGEYDLRDLRLTTNIADLKSANYTGGRLNEIINGDDRSNTIKGGDGEVTIYGKGGNDKLYGGNVNTTENILNGFDYIDGGEGDDTIYGMNGYNNLYGGDGDGDDTIYGGKHYDFINGGAGTNKLYGKQGKNQYIYGGGNDTIYLEKDSETILLLNDYDVVKKIKQGNDAVIYMKDAGTITLKNFFKLENYGYESLSVYKGGSDSSEQVNWFEYGTIAFQANGKGTIKGTDYNDDINASDKADKIYAYGGYDIIDPSLGNDKIYVEGSGSKVTFHKGDGKDTIYGNAGTLNFSGVAYEEISYSRVKNDLVIKYSENDSVTLSEYFNHKSSAETIVAGNESYELHSDILTSYNNKVDYKYGDGTLNFYAMPDGANIVNLNDPYGKFDLDKAQMAKKGNDLIFYGFGAKGDKIVVKGYYKEDIDGYIYYNGYALPAGSLNDMMTYDHSMETTSFTDKYALNDVIEGTDEKNVIKTKDGHDVINASFGADVIYAGSGNDKVLYNLGDILTDNLTIYGEDGNDRIETAFGSDKIYGGNGNDYIDASDSDDNVDGGAGNDEIYGGLGNDTIKGGSGNDYICGGGGENTMYGGKGDDDIYVESDDPFVTDYNLVHGDAGNDSIEVEKGYGNRIYGDAGNDYITVYKDAKNNNIYGGKGNDYIVVQGECNKIYGESGNDSIFVRSNAETSYVNAGAGNDIIEISSDGTPSINGVAPEYNGGSGNDTFIIKGNAFSKSGTFSEIEDDAGNDVYQIEIDKPNFKGSILIEDDKGKDTIKFNIDRDEIILNKFNVSQKNGKIYNLDDVEVSFSIKGNTGSVRIDEYFDSGCIERIETADGYYITKSQMQNVAQEVASWLAENNFGSVADCMRTGEDGQKDALAFIYENINWQM